MNNALLKQILKEYDTKRSNAIQKAELQKKQLLEINPRLMEIEEELSKTSLDTSKAILSSNSKEDKAKLIQELKKKSNQLIKEKNNFIKELTKESTNYLKPHFECNKCKDTGFVIKNNLSQMCTCLKQRIYDIAYNKCNIGNLQQENFSTFNPKLFSDIVDKQAYKSSISPRDNILLLKDKAEQFIENFDDPTEKNLLFIGNTGTGKTFLTNCIANEVLKLGKTVLYQTAPVMLNDVIDSKFGKGNPNFNIIENVLTADLLVIDDLGTENLNSVMVSELFTIINTRLLNQNHKITKTIISTNLNIDELFKTYSTRIGSRLAGNYRILRFFGDDLRLKKKTRD